MLIHRASDQKAGVMVAEVCRWLESISVTDLRQWVDTISIPRHYVAQPENNKWVRDWLVNQLQKFGYAIELQGEFSNMLALPPASGKPITLIGAHYDSVPMTDGADDNASAVAALLGCAKALRSYGSPERTGFVLFNREEDGLRGSLDFVESFVLSKRLPVEQVHVLEMVGFASDEPNSQITPKGLPINIPTTGNFLGLLANSAAAELQTEVLRIAKTYLPAFPVLGLHVTIRLERFFPVLHRSDHAPFWKHNIPAVMWTDTSEFRNHHYHTFGDTPETLNYEFLKGVTQLLIACAIACETKD